MSTRLLRLDDLRDNPGAKQKAQRVGRGRGSGRGKTSTRGHKGQGQRKGLRKRTFEGGQTPLFRRTPKRGFVNSKRQELAELNLDRLVQWVEMGRLDSSSPITMKALRDSGCLRQIRYGVKLLGKGCNALARLKTPLHLEVSFSSEASREAVEAAGGTVKHVWFGRVPLRAHLKPEKFDILPHGNGVPPPKLRYRYPEIEWTEEAIKERKRVGMERRAEVHRLAAAAYAARNPLPDDDDEQQHA